MRATPIDPMIGKKFNKLLVLRPAKKRLHVICRCDCGTEAIIKASEVFNGGSKTCGCGKYSGLRRITTHNKSNAPEYIAWLGMKHRCYNKNCKAYKNYGGRGIIVCARWLESFDNFYNDMGPRPTSKHTLDRFPNQNGNYEPTNCRWATRKQQARNMRVNRLIECNGQTKCLSAWAEILGISPVTLWCRLETKSSHKAIGQYLN